MFLFNEDIILVLISNKLLFNPIFLNLLLVTSYLDDIFSSEILKWDIFSGLFWWIRLLFLFC